MSNDARERPHGFATDHARCPGGAPRKVLFPLSAGAARGIRTPDPVITNDVLYRLSYCGLFRRERYRLRGTLARRGRGASTTPTERSYGLNSWRMRLQPSDGSSLPGSGVGSTCAS